VTLEPVRRRIATLRETLRAAALVESGERTLLDALAPDWTEQTKDTYTVAADGHEHHCRTLLIRDWPPRVNAGWLAPLLFDLAGDVSIGLHTERLAKGAAAKRARNARVVQTTDALARAEAGKLSDPATQLNVASAEQIALDVEAGAEALYSCTVALTLRAPTAGELDTLTRRVQEHLGASGVRVSPALWEQRGGFLSTVSYAGPTLERPRTVDTSTLALSWPFLGQDLGTRDGPLIGIALADRAPVHLDLWAREEGWNAPGLCIVSPPGGGKTVTIGTLAARHLTQPDAPDVLLVDPMKGDYRRLVRELGGQIVRLSTSPDVVCNPLDLPPATILSGTGETSEQNPVTEQTRLVTGLLALMVTDPGPDGAPGRMTRAERAVAEGAVLAAYAGAGILPNDAGTWDATPADVPALPDVLAALERQAADHGSTTARSVAERLAPFCRGTLAALFSRPTTLRLDAGLTSFDLEGLDSELRPLAVWLIGDYVWKVAKRDRRRRILSMDEVKTLLEYPESARLVAHLYTLGRAYHLSVWSATQLLSDYGSTPEGERALQSADTVLLLRQAPGRGSGDAQARYGLTAGDRAWLEACGQGAGVLRTPKGTGRVQVTPSPLELALMGGPEAA
jgi:hypothetical protein